MTFKLKTTLYIVATFLANQVNAADNLITLNFNQAVQQGYDEGVLDKSISYYLEGQKHPEIKKNHGEYKSNKKTNGVGKDQTKSCNWVLLSVLKAYQQRAQQLGANAVINIKSNYKSRVYIDSKNYQCGDGLLMSGVALKGDIATLK